MAACLMTDPVCVPSACLPKHKPSTFSLLAPPDQDSERILCRQYCSAACTSLHQHPLPPPFTPAEVQEAGKNKVLFPKKKPFQNERGCQFLSNNNFQVQWAVKAQDMLNWTGNNIAEITKKYCKSQRKKSLELQEGHQLCCLTLLFSCSVLTLFELLVTGKSIIFCLNLSGLKIHKPKERKIQILSIFSGQGMIMLLKHVQHFKTLAVKRQRIIQSRRTAVPDLSELGHHVFIESWIFCFLSIICSSHDST